MFKLWHYIKLKIQLTLKSTFFNLCVNINCIMSLMNHETVFFHFFKIKIKKTFKLILMHNIESNIYNNVNYVVLILLISEKINEKLTLTQIQ